MPEGWEGVADVARPLGLPAMGDFDDLLAANKRYAISSPGRFDGIAYAGVCVVMCMDSRLEPLGMMGLFVGEAKILRTPGGHVTPDAEVGCVVGVHLLGVNRILVIGHTRCAMASGTDEEIAARIRATTGADASGMTIGADPDQQGRLRSDVARLRENPMIAGRAKVGGFMYDVDTGLLTEVA